MEGARHSKPLGTAPLPRPWATFRNPLQLRGLSPGHPTLQVQLVQLRFSKTHTSSFDILAKLKKVSKDTR